MKSSGFYSPVTSSWKIIKCTLLFRPGSLLWPGLCSAQAVAAEQDHKVSVCVSECIGVCVNTSIMWEHCYIRTCTCHRGSSCCGHKGVAHVAPSFYSTACCLHLLRTSVPPNFPSVWHLFTAEMWKIGITFCLKVNNTQSFLISM